MQPVSPLLRFPYPILRSGGRSGNKAGAGGINQIAFASCPLRSHILSQTKQGRDGDKYNFPISEMMLPFLHSLILLAVKEIEEFPADRQTDSPFGY